MAENAYEASKITHTLTEQVINVNHSGEVRVQGKRYTNHFSCDKGDVVRLYATYTDQVGAPFNPTALHLRVKDPLGIVTDHVSGWVNPNTGEFHFDLLVDVSGIWHYRWESNDSVAERNFSVKESYFAA